MTKRKHHSLYGQILQRLDTAFAKVKANRGAAGVDRESIAEFELNLEANLAQLKRDLKEKTYAPQPVFEPLFCDSSYGFRPRRSAHQAWTG
jgi:RNA-directed DNA polymerase